jgi:L-2-hydroxyglutarate oxidase LhgO
VPVSKIGKLLIANGEQEIEKLHALHQQASVNGVSDLHFMKHSELEEKAPQIRVQEALWSPSTGIIDSHQLMLSYIHQLESNGGQYVGNTRFLSAQVDGRYFTVTLDCDGDLFTLQCKHLINAAGLFAQRCAQKITELDPFHIPELYYCKGQYFNYQGKHPFKHLIYPMPEQHGLGIHATLDLAGQLKFGPDTEFVDSLDYTPSEHNKANFVNAISRYWPTIDESKLHASYSGIRPKLQRADAQDFVIQDSQTHELPGLINLFGIESPGLTASLAIADRVAEKLLS